jgi:hypothetical protein
MRERTTATPASDAGAALETKADKAFGDFVAYEKPRRCLALTKMLQDVLTSRSAEYLAAQPIRIDKRHPFFGQAARCGEMLTGCDAADVLHVHIDPTQEGPLRDGEIAMVTVMVYTSDRRWHEAPNVTVERLVGAWLDARQ